MDFLRATGPYLACCISVLILWKLNQKKNFIADIYISSMGCGGLAGYMIAEVLNAFSGIRVSEPLFFCLGIIIGETVGAAMKYKQS